MGIEQEFNASSPDDVRAELHVLHGKYREFMTALYQTGGYDVEIFDFRKFCEWWNALGPRTQKRRKADFQRGYDFVLSLAKEKVSEVIDEYTKRSA